MFKDKRTSVRKGQWYFYCCELDLWEAEEDIEWGQWNEHYVFDTREEAIKYMQLNGLESCSGG